MQVVAADVRERILRLVGEGQELLGLLPGILDRVDTLEQRCETLQRELDALQTEHRQLLSERGEIAESLSGVLHQLTRPMTEVAEKPGTP